MYTYVGGDNVLIHVSLFVSTTTQKVMTGFSQKMGNKQSINHRKKY